MYAEFLSNGYKNQTGFSPSVFNISLRTRRALMHWKTMSVRYNCINSTIYSLFTKRMTLYFVAVSQSICGWTVAFIRACADPERCVSAGLSLTTCFLYLSEWGEERGYKQHIKRVIIGTPCSETSFEWRFAGGPMTAQRWILVWKLCDL